MLSDTIFDSCEMILKDVARYKAGGDWYDDDQLNAVVDSLAEFSARGIELDIGGDGLLDSFVSDEAKASFIADAKVRLRERLDELVKEMK